LQMHNGKVLSATEDSRYYSLGEMICQKSVYARILQFLHYSQHK
jgi:hypothetical protein